MNTSTDEADAAFPSQQQDPPGLTSRMEPEPDHGEYSYVGSGRMRDIVSLITGGDSGIGRAAAIAFAREGADVAFTYLPEELEDAEITRDWVLKEGVRCLAIEADLRTSAACDEVVNQVVSEFGRIDALVNNAGYQMARDGGMKGSTTSASTGFSRRTSTASSGRVDQRSSTFLPAARLPTTLRSRRTTRPPPCSTTHRLKRRS